MMKITTMLLKASGYIFLVFFQVLSITIFRYLLKKLKENDNIPTNLYNHFHTSLLESNKLYHVIPVDRAEDQTGSSVNNIIIKDLDKGILRVRYLDNRKLTNNLLKHDYKISKNMINNIKYDKDIHKL